MAEPFRPPEAVAAFNSAVAREERLGYCFASPPDYTYAGLRDAGLLDGTDENEDKDEKRGSYVIMIRRKKDAPMGEVLRVYHRDGHVEYREFNFAEHGL